MRSAQDVARSLEIGLECCDTLGRAETIRCAIEADRAELRAEIVEKAKDVVLAYADCYQPTEKMLADLDGLRDGKECEGMSESRKVVTKACPFCAGSGQVAVVNHRWLQWALGRLGWKQADLARALGMSRPYVNDMFHGRRAIGQSVIAVLRKAGIKEDP